MRGKEKWVIKLPWLQPLRNLFERSHLLIEAIACGQRDSIIHATVGKLKCCPFDMMQHFRISSLTWTCLSLLQWEWSCLCVYGH
jgi:hypothetical protein